MEIPETVWAEAKEISEKIFRSYIQSFDRNSDTEIIARAILAERERCAQIADSFSDRDGDFDWNPIQSYEISQAIRNPLHKQT